MKKLIVLVLVVLSGLWLFRSKAEIEVKAREASSAKSALSLPAPRAAVTAIPPIVTKPQFQRAVVLGEKVLHTKKELGEYHALLASSTILQESQTRLLDLKESAHGAEAESARMQTVDYLNAALAWKENPQREGVIKAITQILDRPVSDLRAPLELKRSLAGDAMELYWVLYKHEPTRADDIYDRAPREQQRLFRFATKLVKQNKSKGGN